MQKRRLQTLVVNVHAQNVDFQLRPYIALKRYIHLSAHRSWGAIVLYATALLLQCPAFCPYHSDCSAAEMEEYSAVGATPRNAPLKHDSHVH